MLIFQGNPNKICLSINEKLKIHNKGIHQTFKGCRNVSINQRYRKYINNLVHTNDTQLLSNTLNVNGSKIRENSKVIFEMYYSTTVKEYDESMPQIRFYFQHFPVLQRSWIDIVVTTESISHYTNLDKHKTLGEMFPNEIIPIKHNSVRIFLKPKGGREETILLHLGNKFQEKNVVKFYLMFDTRTKEFQIDTSSSFVNYTNLKWIFAELLIKWKPYVCVSVPGKNRRDSARMLLDSPAQQPLYVYWMYNNHQQHNYYRIVTPILCSKLNFSIFWNFDYCLNFSSSNRLNPQQNYYYLFFRQHLSKYHSNQNTKISWNEAFLICQNFGGSLPIISSKNKLDDLIALMKLSPVMPPVDALYIGLTQDTEKVRPLCNNWL